MCFKHEFWVKVEKLFEKKSCRWNCGENQWRLQRFRQYSITRSSAAIIAFNPDRACHGMSGLTRSGRDPLVTSRNRPPDPPGKSNNGARVRVTSLQTAVCIHLWPVPHSQPIPRNDVNQRRTRLSDCALSSVVTPIHYWSAPMRDFSNGRARQHRQSICLGAGEETPRIPQPISPSLTTYLKFGRRCLFFADTSHYFS